MTTGAFSWNIGKLFSKLKLVTDHLFIYAAANWEATERKPSHKEHSYDLLNKLKMIHHNTNQSKDSFQEL